MQKKHCWDKYKRSKRKKDRKSDRSSWDSSQAFVAYCFAILCPWRQKTLQWLDRSLIHLQDLNIKVSKPWQGRNCCV
jgi:hypothetical protein